MMRMYRYVVAIHLVRIMQQNIGFVRRAFPLQENAGQLESRLSILRGELFLLSGLHTRRTLNICTAVQMEGPSL